MVVRISSDTRCLNYIGTEGEAPDVRVKGPFSGCSDDFTVAKRVASDGILRVSCVVGPGHSRGQTNPDTTAAKRRRGDTMAGAIPATGLTREEQPQGGAGTGSPATPGVGEAVPEV